MIEDPKEEWKRLRTAFIQSNIERYHRLYTWTRNPVHAFNAYRLSRHDKIDVPGWILELLDQWAEVLCVKSPKGGKAIADALGLGSKAGPSITKQAETEIRDLWIAEGILALRDRHPERPKLDIFHEIAEEFKLSSDRVGSIWYELTGETKP
jgi:hypothetical protein